MMYDSLKCLFLTASITAFAQAPEFFDWEIEKIGFAALLFFIIWTYMKNVLPKSHEEMERKNNRIAELIGEVRHMNTLREKDQQTIAALTQEVKQHVRSMKQHGKKEENEE